MTQAFLVEGATGKSINDLAAQNEAILIYGAGSHGSDWISWLQQCNIRPVAVVDADAKKCGTFLHGVPIVSISHAATKYGSNSVLIVDLHIYGYMELDAFMTSQLYGELSAAGFCRIGYVPSHFGLLFTRYAEQVGVVVSEDIIETAQFRIPNVHKFANLYLRESFYLESKDFIFGNFDPAFYSEGPYEYGNVILKEGDVVMDCGANMGLFSALAAAKNCMVHAFEPLPEVQTCLERTAELYPGKIIIEKYALGAVPSRQEFVYSLHNMAIGSLFPDLQAIGSTKKSIQVNVTTIDKFVQDNRLGKVDFIKADIEGAERAMLAGAVETLRKYSPRLAICTYHLPDDPDVLEDIIKTANPRYHVIHKWKKLYAAVEPFIE